jgi:hypothetical protein
MTKLPKQGLQSPAAARPLYAFITPINAYNTLVKQKFETSHPWFTTPSQLAEAAGWL